MTQKPAALVTGAGKRLGRSMALYLASKGYDLVLHYRQSKSECESLIPTIESFGGKACLLQADLSQPELAAPLIESAFDAFPNLELLINNASIFYPKSFLETDDAIFDAYFDVHVKSPYFLMQTFAKICEKGHVINLLDTDVTTNKTTYFPYLLSKKCLADLTLMGAKALGPKIRVNGIAPGYILPPEGENEDRKTHLEKTLPLRCVGDPVRIQEALQSLLDLSFTTGQILYIDGGQHLL